MISQTAEYALRAMVHIANTESGFVSSSEIAKATHVPIDYLLKILQDLAQKGLLQRKRGPSGGFMLAKTTQEITILEVVEIFDPIRRIDKCPLGIEGHTSLCPLHKKLDSIAGELQCHLASVSLSDLIRNKKPVLCKIKK